MMIIIIGNGNGLAARGTHPHRASWIGSCGGCGLCIYNMGLVFFWVGFYRVAHVKIPLSSVVCLFGTGEKTALLFTEFFGNYFECLLKHWSGQTWESRYISLPASIKCKPDSHNQRPDSPNEHFSLWSPKPMLYFIKLGGAHRPPLLILTAGPPPETGKTRCNMTHLPSSTSTLSSVGVPRMCKILQVAVARGMQPGGRRAPSVGRRWGVGVVGSQTGRQDLGSGGLASKVVMVFFGFFFALWRTHLSSCPSRVVHSPSFAPVPPIHRRECCGVAGWAPTI